MMSTIRNIFVYGTLRPGQKYHHLINDLLLTAEPATVTGFVMYDLAYGYPAIVSVPPIIGSNPESHEASMGNVFHDTIYGDILSFSESDIEDALSILDELESYYEGSPDNEYDRILVDAENSLGKRESCWLYTYPVHKATWLHDNGVPVSTGDWVAWKKRRSY